MSRRGPRLNVPPKATTRLRYVEESKNSQGAPYLYYRRSGRRIPLPMPEGTAEFLRAYYTAEAQFQKARPEAATISDAITEYLDDPDFAQLAPASRKEYRRVLDHFRAQFGVEMLIHVDEQVIDILRGRHREEPINWNSLRSRMIQVIDRWRRIHPGTLPANHWRTSRRMKVAASDQNRPWPPEVLRAVMRAATPAFRALLAGYLLTAQRGADVTQFSPDAYDPDARTLQVAQHKTGEALRLHVPDALARAIEASRGVAPGRLFATPRGEAWTVGNAQETLARLLKNLGIERYTLHGLRATGPVALKMLGFENRAIRALTGHTSDSNLETYLRGVDHHALARPAQEALAAAFGDVIEVGEGANRRRFSGVTGKTARKAREAKQ